MNKLQEIIALISQQEFPNKFNQYNHEDFFNKLKAQLQNVYIDSGISKAVIIAKGIDKVIKIPFNSMFSECDYDDAATYCTELPNTDDFIYDFFCATLSSGEGWDYCALETEIYDLARQNELDLYFAEVSEWIDPTLRYPIYIQPRCKMLEEDDRFSDQELEKVSTYCHSKDINCFNPYWILDFISFYGETEFERLSNFLKENNITDLHGGNLGYLDGCPVIVDYASFREW